MKNYLTIWINCYTLISYVDFIIFLIITHKEIPCQIIIPLKNGYGAMNATTKKTGIISGAYVRMLKML